MLREPFYYTVFAVLFCRFCSLALPFLQPCSAVFVLLYGLLRFKVRISPALYLPFLFFLRSAITSALTARRSTHAPATIPITAPRADPEPAVASGALRHIKPRPEKELFSPRFALSTLLFYRRSLLTCGGGKATHRRRSEKQKGCRIRQPFCENNNFYLHVTSMSTSAGYLFAGVPFAVYFNTRVMVSPSIWSAQGFVNSTVISCPVRTSTVSL